MNLANLGLKALLSDINNPIPTSDVSDAATLASTSNLLRKLPIDALQPGKYQPRHDIDPSSLEELANSIRTQGVIQPILVRKVTNGNFEIIAGERRWRAAQLAALPEIPAIVKDISDEQAIAMALIENIQRENLNSIDTALALQRLISEFNMTHNDVAETVGKSRTTVTNLIRLLELHDDVKTMVQRGELEMGHARALLPLDPIKQIQTAKLIIDKELSVRATEKLIRDIQDPKKKTHTAKQQDPDIIMLQNQLKDKLGTKINIRHTTKGSGKIIIHYNNLDEFEGILDHLN